MTDHPISREAVAEKAREIWVNELRATAPKGEYVARTFIESPSENDERACRAIAYAISLRREGEPAPRETWRHVKRGTVYEVLGDAELQDAAGFGQHEHACLTIYRDEDGKLWARNSAEFQDGRFERIITSATPLNPSPSCLGVVEALEWIALFAEVRSQDDSKTFARVNRGALRTIAEKSRTALQSHRGDEKGPPHDRSGPA
jgi:hypothetical protein